MATREPTSNGLLSRFLGLISRAILIVSFTGVETVALVVWLGFVEDAPVISRASAIGLGVLAVGLVVEHFLTDQAVNGVDLSFPVGRGVLFSTTETALWALWLLVAERFAGLEGFLVAGGVLAVLLVPQHTIEDNALRGRGLFSTLVNRRTVGFSLIEASGATVWLLFVRRGDLIAPFLEGSVPSTDPAILGVGILAFALFIEHNIGVAFSRRPE